MLAGFKEQHRGQCAWIIMVSGQGHRSIRGQIIQGFKGHCNTSGFALSQKASFQAVEREGTTPHFKKITL